MAWVTFRARLAVFILLVLLPVSLYSQVEIEGSLAGTLETNTYFVTGDISVDAGDSLYLEPGSNFLFQGAFDFTINGALYADGDEADTISFGPNEMVPTWYGILFTNSASDFSVMEYCKIYGSSDHGLHCNNSSPTFNHCLIYDNDTEDTGVGTHWRGGGVYAQSSGMTLRNCTIRDNTSRRGAGVYAWRTPAPTIINCLITGNSAIIQNNQGGHGGGIYYYVCSPTIRGSTISHNTAEDLSAGIQCWFSSPVIEDCIIEFNNAEGSGGGIGLERQASPEISNTTFRGNITQENGGGISVNDTSMATFEGCFFEANSAMESGGAVFIYRRSQPSFFKSTFVGNTADEGGGIYVGFFSNLTFVDGIIEGTAEGSAIQVSNDAIISSLRYSNLYNNDDEDFTGNVPGGLGVLSTINANQDSCDAFNNIFLDPDFVDAANGDFNLEEESPCINAGDPTSPVDPDGTVADMGAYPFFHDTPVQFDLLSPLDGDTCWTLDTTLTWEMTTDPNGIVPHFDVWIDTLDDLSTAWLAADSTADTTYDLEDLLDNHNYYWTVRATDNNTEGMWANDTFRVHTYLYEAPDAFELSSPDSGSVIDEDTVIVSWTTATDSDPGDAITYTVEWSLDSDFGELYSGTTQDTTFSITDLEDAIQQGEFDELPDDITVYWRVRATDRGGLETDATPDHGWSFDVFLLESPDPFDLLSPANDDTCWDGDTTVTWEATTDPDAGDEITYWLFWSDDTDFEFGVDSVSTDDTTYALTNLDDDQWVYWKVRAQDTNTSGTWSSNTRRFRVFIPEPPSNFALFAPTNNSTIYDDSVTAFWTESEDPDPGDQVLYTVEWSLDSDYDNSYTGTTTDDFFQITDLEDQIQQWYGDELDELPDDVRIYWRVSASDNYGNVVRAIPNNGWSFRVYLAEPPAEFSLLSPGDGDTCWTGDTTFTWETAVDPDPDDQVFYRLIFATNEEFTENLDSVNTANTSYPFENLTDNQTYWWRVHAQDGNTDGTYSNETFQLHINIINPPEAFSLLSPENNDTIWTDSTSLTWELTTDPDPDDSVHYVIWWATDQDFTQNLDSASTEEGDTSYVFNNLPDDTHYWWKVRAQDRNSNGAWSDETFNFQVYIIESPGNFSLAGPADESIVQNDTVTVSWTIAEDPDENDVVTYHVEWSEESDFSDFYTGSTTDTIFAIAAMNDLDELNDNMHIYWRVRAEDNYNNEVWGSPQSGWSFYTNYLDETPDNFSLLSPGNGDTCFTGDTTLTWEATTDPDPGDEVDHYVIWWATDDNFTQNLDSATSTGTSFDFEDLLDDVTYRWKVRAQDNNTTGRWSDETYLLVSYIPEAPNDFDLASPANGSTINNDTVTVRWTESSDNDLNDNLFYEVEWSVFENFNESYTGITTDTSLTITGLQDQDGIPDDTTIYWRVKVVDSFGLETYAEPETGWSFDIFIIEPPESFSLLAPDDGDTCWTGDTTLVWESTLDSDPDDDIDYIVWWANDENFTQNLDSSNVGDDTTFALNNLSDDTSFWWKVRAQDTNTSGTWSSDEFQFHVYIPEAPGDFALASPDSGSQKQDGDVIVRWTTSTDPDPNDVITYTVQWSEDEDFDDFESVTTSNLSYTIADLDDDLTIYWRVRANDLYGNQTNADPSAGWSFDTYYYENPLAFNLLSPANDDTVWDGDTVLTWRSTTDPDPGDNIDYIVWWATNSSFTQGLDSVNAGSDSTYDLINLSDDTRYWWKVRAQDDNTTGTWSNQTRYFDVFVIEAPEDFDLASPADGSEINDTQTTLRWTSSDDNDPDDDITYHIEWADNQNFDNFSTSSTTDTFHILTDLQDSDNETIYWRVKAVDEFGLVTWADPSTGWSFDVDIHEAPLAFNLLSPQNDDTTWSGDTTLTWESTTDPDPDTDIDYIVWWATNSSFTQGLDSVNTGSDTTYNLINLSDDTRYWWKVRAQDDNTSGTWSNQTRYFDVFIIEAPEDFDLASPTDGSDINNTQATLRWTSSDDNDPNDDITYHVEWADNQNFNNFSTTSTADTFHILTNLQDSDDETIYWRVKAVDEFGRVTWADPSTGWSFDVDIHEAPLAFDLLSPQNDDTTWSGDTTLTWESTTDPDPDTDIDYIVWWATNSSFTQGLDSVNAGSDLTYDLTNLSDDTRYWWKVRAQDDNTTGTWSSQTRYFDVFIIEAPGDFDLSSPADGIEINDEQVTLRWTVSTDNDPGDAVTYHVDWADNQNFNNFSTTSTTNNFYLLSNLETYDDTTVYWRVKAVDEYGLETSADPAGGWSFDVDIHQAPLAFDLLSPGNGDTTWTGDTTLVWESTTDPDPDTDIDYIVWWATNSSFTQGLDSANVGSDTTYNLNNLNDDTVYWWKVRAQDENTSGRWSTNTRRFVVFIIDTPDNFSLLSPLDGDTCWTGDTTLVWESTTDADPDEDISYIVWWATDSNFTQDLDSANVGGDTLMVFDNLDDDTAYWWKVRAQDNNSVGTWSDETNHIEVYIIYAPGAFSLLSPDSGSVVEDDSVIVVWSQALDFDGNDVVTYTVEWSTDSDFNTSYTGTTTDTTFNITDLQDLGEQGELDELEDNIRVYWKVSAEDMFGLTTNGSPANGWWFDVDHARQAPDAFGLTGPVDGDTCWNGDTTLVWEASAEHDPQDSLFYRVFWSTDENFILNVDSANTTNTSYQLTNLPEDLTYWWKVRAQDTNTSGTWSDETYSFFVFISEEPGEFDLAYPDSGAVINDNTVTVGWTEAIDPDTNDVVTYTVEWSNDSDFDTYYTGTTTDTFFAITAMDDLDELADDQTIYWRVKAADRYGNVTNGTPSAGWYFEIYIEEPPGNFGLLLPSDDDTVWTESAALSWETANEPDPNDDVTYWVWWATDANFTQNLDSTSTNDTDYDLENLVDGSTYWWKVRAQDEGTVGVWSDDVFSFVSYIVEAPEDFDLASPANNSTFDVNDITIRWTSSSDNDEGDTLYYEAEWSGSDDFSNSTTGITTDTFVTISNIPDDTTIYWRVKAVDTYGVETYATPESGWFFNIYIEESPGNFSLLSPNDEDTIWTEDASLSWETALEPDPDDDVTYWVWWATDANFTQNLDSTSTTNTTFNLTNLTDGSSYWWKVRAQDEGTVGTWSDETFSFLIYIVEAPEPFDLVSPANDSTFLADDVTLQWTASSDNDEGDTLYYMVEWSGNSDFSVFVDSITIGTSITLLDLPDDTTIYWRVKAVDTYGVETYAEPETGWYFNIAIPESPSGFDLLSPATGSICNSGDTTLIWQTSIDPDPGDEVSYVVWWRQGMVADSAVTTDTFFAFDNLTDGAFYIWRIRAIDENSPDVWSNQTFFLRVTIPDAPGEFDLAEPANGTAIDDDNVTVYWESSTDIDAGDQITYHVEWSGYDDFSESYSGTTTDTFLTITGFEDLDELPDDTTVYWRVKAVDTYNLETYATPETGWYFEIYIEEPPGDFGLLSPNDEDTIWTENATLSWETSLEPDPGDDVTYWIWWATDANFTLNLDSTSTTDTTYDLSNLTDGSTYWWKVRAQDEGTEGIWSDDTFSFLIYVVEAPEPFDLTLPANDSTLIIDSVKVQWSASSDNDDGDTLYYEVEWSGFDDFSVSFTSITIDTFHSITGLPDDTTIYWRVKAVDTYGVETYADPEAGWFFHISIPGSPSAFSLIAPENLATCWTGDTTLVWETSIDPDVGDEITYVIWWLTSDNTMDSASTADTFYAFDNLTNGLTYWWRVRAQDENTPGTWSNETHQLEVIIPNAPGDFDLTSPADGTVINADNVTVYWETSIDADLGDQITYHVEWSGYDDFTEPYTETTTDTFFTITDFEELGELPDDTTLYWRVKAVDEYNLETYANPETGWYFEIYIEEPPGNFGLLAPSDEDTIWTENATLSWETSVEPDPGDDVTYWVWWATDLNFTLNLDSASTTDTTYDLANLTDGSTYYWKVRAQDEGTVGVWSDDTFSFLIYVVEAPEPFNLTLPANDSTLIIDSVTVRWSASSDIDDGDTLYYEVEWSGFDDFSVSFTNITIDTLHSISGLPDDTTIYWRVKAVDTYGVETYADPGTGGWFFNVSVPAFPSAFSLISPENLDTCWTGDTTLVWEASVDPDVGDEITYWVWFLDSDNVLDSASTVDTFYAFDNLTNGLTYWWRVRAQDENTSGTWSNETHQLEVIIPNPPEDFDLLAPASGTVFDNGDVTVNWGSSSDSDPGDDIYYQVEWSGFDDFSVFDNSTTTDTFVTINNIPDDTTIYWRVKAVDEYNMQTYANPGTGWYFEIYIEDPPGNFGLLSPDDADTVWSGTADLEWETSVEPDPGDDVTYWIWWAADVNFSVGLDSISTIDTTYSLTNLDDETTYWWKVRAQDENGNGVWSDDVYQFESYILNPPEDFSLTSPANGSTNNNETVTVGWASSSDTDDGDTLYYVVEWSGFDDFSVSFTSVTTDTFYSISDLPDDTTIYWRVKAVDSFGLQTWADPNTGWYFNIYVPGPPDNFSLISPADTDTFWTSSDTVTWETAVEFDVDDSVTYWIWWAFNSGFSIGLDSASTTDTSYVFTDLVDDTTYYWKVRAQDVNTTGTWSDETYEFRVFIVVPPDAFNLVSPVNGSTENTNDITVSWTSSDVNNDGAELSYVVEWSGFDDFSDFEDSSITVTSLTIANIPDDTTIYWRVKAVDSYGPETWATPNTGWYFNIYIPETPDDFSLLSPIDDDSCWSGDTTLTWEVAVENDPDDSVTYWIYWANNQTFTLNLDSASTTSTSFDFTNLNDDTNYWWKVLAEDTNTQGTWSDEVFKLTSYIPEAPDNFSLTSPANDSTLESGTVTIYWSPSSDNDPGDSFNYIVDWSGYDDFTFFSTNTTTDTFQVIADIPDDTTIYWRVRAVDSFGLVTWADPDNGWYFNINAPEQPEDFSLLSPFDDDTCWTGDTTLTWEVAVENDPNDSVTYWIYWANNQTFTLNLDSASTTSTLYAFNNLNDDTNYWWKVLALDTNTSGTWSDEVFKLTCYIPEAPGNFALTSPPNDITLDADTATIYWSSSIDNDPGDQLIYIVDWSGYDDFSVFSTNTTTDTFHVIPDIPDDTTIYWRVRAVDSFGLVTTANPNTGWHFNIFVEEAPGNFSLIAPVDGDTCWDGDTTLTWETSANYDPGDQISYKVWWATDANFTQNLDSASMTDTTYNFNNLTDDVTYWWKVKAEDENSNITWSSETNTLVSYIPEAPAAFSLADPANDNIVYNDTAIVYWTSSSDGDPGDAIDYIWQWSYESDFSVLNTGSTTDTSLVIPGIPDDTTIYWRVKAIDTFGLETWADPNTGWYFHIYVEDTPLAFSLLTPGDGDTVWTSDTTITWEATTDPDPDDTISYVIYGALDENFILVDSMATDETSFTLTGLFDDMDYWWKVRAQDTNTEGTWSDEVFQFATYFPEPPAAFSLVSPGGTDTCWTGDTTLTWNATTDPDPDDQVTYWIWWATDQNFTQNLDSAFTTITSHTIVGWSDDETYWWKVRAQDTNTLGTWSSDTLSFAVYIPENPNAFSLSYPADGSQLDADEVEVGWTSSSDNDPGDTFSYTVEWGVDTLGAAVYTATTTDTFLIITDLADQLGQGDLDELPDDITIRWKVKAVDGFGLETYATPTNGFTFDIFIYEPPAAFSLLSPLNEDTCWFGDTTLTWEATTDPDPGDNISYKLWWATDQNFTQDLDSISTTNTQHDLTDLTQGENYWWKVRAQDTNTSGTWSDDTFQFFVYQPEAPEDFSLSSPDDGSQINNDTVTVWWTESLDNDQGDQVTYLVEWATDDQFTETFSGTTQDTFLTIANLADMLGQGELDELPDDTTIYWRVTASDLWNLETQADPSDGWSFEIYIIEPPSAFSLTSPDDGDTCFIGDTTLTWETSVEPDPEDSITYWVWWATDQLFTQDLDSTSTTDTEYELTDMIDESIYWWKVRAQDTNTTGTWSDEVFTIVVTLPEPPGDFSLDSPEDESVIEDDTVTVFWTTSIDDDLEDTVSYRVEWSTDVDFTVDLYQAVTRDTFLAITDLEDLVGQGELDELPDDTTVYWRVTATDRWNFETQADPPEGWSFSIYIPETPETFDLISPLNDDTCWTGDTTFTWEPSNDPDPDNDVLYDLYWTLDPEFGELWNVEADLDTIAFDFTDLTDDTTYWWTVFISDENTNGTWASDTFALHVFIPEAPLQFGLAEPDSGAFVNDDTARVVWTASSDNDPNDPFYYLVEWSLDTNYAVSYTSTTMDTFFDITDLQQAAMTHNRNRGDEYDELPDDSTIYWRVKAIDGFGFETNAEPATGWSFDIYIYERPAIFTLLSPGVGDTCWTGDTTLVWRSSSDPDPNDPISYVIWWASDLEFEFIQDSIVTTDTTFDMIDLGDDQSWWWKVRAQDTNTEGTWSDTVFSFYVTILDPPEAFSILSPVDGVELHENYANLSWEESIDTDLNDSVRYMLDISLDPDFLVYMDITVYDTTFLLNDISDLIFNLTQKQPGGDNSPMVKRGNGKGHNGDFNSFGLKNAKNIMAENAGINQSESIFNSLDSHLGGNGLSNDMLGNSIGTGKIGLDELDELPDDLTIYWRVRALDTQGHETISDQGEEGVSFSIYVYDLPSAFDLQSPSNGELIDEISPLLSWQSSFDPDPDDVLYYVILWSKSEDFTTDVDSSQSGNRSFFTMSEHAENGDYWWKVRAQDSNTEGTWSNQVFSFTLEVTERPPGPFYLLTPSYNTTVNETEIDLTWEGQKSPMVVNHEYSIWWAKDSLFDGSNGIVDSSRSSDTLFTIDGLEDDTRYWWKVRALFADTGDVWSSNMLSFNVYLVEPPSGFSLASPLDDTTFSQSEVTVSWLSASDPDPGDFLTYRVEWAMDPDFDNINFVSTRDTFYTISDFTGGFTQIAPGPGDGSNIRLNGIIKGNPEGASTKLLYMPGEYSDNTSPGKTGSLINTFGTDGQNSIDNLGDDVTVYWRVRVVDKFGLEENCSPGNGRSFYIDVPEPPLSFSLASPSDLTDLRDTIVTFIWNTTVDPDPYDSLYYELWLDTLASMRTGIKIAGPMTDTVFTYSNFQNFYNYFWRVNAQDANSDGTFSAQTFSFYVPNLYRRFDQFAGQPEESGIHTLFPNPFNSEAMVVIGLMERSDLHLSIYDILGREVASIAKGSFEPGYHRLRFSAEHLPSGVYIVRAITPGGKMDAKRKIVLVR